MVTRLLSLLRLVSVFVAPQLVSACVGGGDSATGAGVVLPTDAPFGPRIIFDPLAVPIPEVPLPSDLLLQRTGDDTLAWNVSRRAPTAMERQIRDLLPTLDGFGSFAPISVSFDQPIDLDSVHAGSALLVDITPGDTWGELVGLDFGDGHFPIVGGGRFWAFDDKQDLPDFLLPADNDYPYQGETERVTHYEVETNTLILRPLVPLSAGHRYAVLLTKDIVGADTIAEGEDSARGRPIRSPFPYKSHSAQAHLVAEALPLAELTQDELAFGWTFTVGDPDKPLQEVRDGLYGRGEFSRFSRQFPPNLGEIRDTGISHDGNGSDYPLDTRDHRYVVQGDYLDAILGVVIGISGGFSVDFEYVDYVVFGSMPTPDVRLGPRKTFAPDASSTQAASVPWLISIPKTTERFKPPFPVVFYFHGTGSSRFEFLALANNLARQGLATVAYDQVGHGPIVPDIKSLLAGQGLDPEQIEVFLPLLVNFLAPDRAAEFEGLSFQEAYDKLLGIGFFAELAFYGRTEDVTGDGALTSSESFFFADPFQQCGTFQQDLVDFVQFVRTLRSFSQDAVPDAIEDPKTASVERLMQNLMAGDFNADGILDLGGDVPIGTAGTSLGGIHAFMAAAIEPEVRTATPIAAGGGLADILVRSTLRQITRVIYLEVFGPLLIACPDGAGGLHLSLNDESDTCRNDPKTTAFAHIPAAPAGTAIRLENQDNGEVETLTLTEDGQGFSLPIPTDRWDELLVEVTLPDTSSPAHRLRVLSPYQGLALHRNSPEFRRFVAITQHALDRCDPVAFARRLFVDPDGRPARSVLFENVIGDRTVPISSGISLARAAGVLGQGDDAQAIMDDLIRSGAVQGAQVDVDDLMGNNESPALGPLPTVPSGPDGTGRSAIRFAFANGRHEWIAGPTDNTEYAAHTMSRNRIAIFHASGGTVISDDICLADETCPLLDTWMDHTP